MTNEASFPNLELITIDNLEGAQEELPFEMAEKMSEEMVANWVASNERFHTYTPEQMEKLLAYLTPEQLQAKTDGNFLAYFLTQDGSLVGTSFMIRDGERYVFRTTNVIGSYRGSGLATRIYDVLCDRVKQLGETFVDIESALFPDTLRFHLKYGFIESGERGPLEQPMRLIL